MSTPLDVPPTAPGVADTYEVGAAVPSLALVLLWSASEPERIGEVAFLPAFEHTFFGRGSKQPRKFLLFARHLPGVRHAATLEGGFLRGDSISREQLAFHTTALTVEMKKVGQCGTLVNGVASDHALLVPGDTLMLHKEALFLVVRRSTMLPVPGGRYVLPAFGGPDAGGMVGESEAMWRLRVALIAAALGGQSVLVQGESGTGKELAARFIHECSARAGFPFVSQNAASFTLSILEAELFGSVANFPNPGTPARTGLFAAADRGTLFLDEIGDLPLDAQTQLLRALDSGEFKPVGESIPRRADVRFVGATNKDDSHFRSDFRARLVRQVTIPPLRERPEDVPLLVRHLLRRIAAAERFFAPTPSGRLEPRVSGRLVDYLVRQPLPLNVREVYNFLVAAVDASEGDEVKLPGASKSEAGQESAKEGAPSKAQILACLEAEDWNVARAARKLGIGRNTVYRLMQVHGIKRDGDETTP